MIMFVFICYRVIEYIVKTDFIQNQINVFVICTL